MVTGGQPKKSVLELFTKVMVYVTSLTVLGTLLFGVHVWVKGQTKSDIAENFPFLCGYITSGIVAKEDPGCKTPTVLEQEYQDKQKVLNTNIINELAVYIPLKVSSNIIDASSEKTFITDTYGSKVDINKVIAQFEQVRKNSESLVASNISCAGLTITNSIVFSTQCTVYGSTIGEPGDAQGRTLGSARIEATRFIENLANSNESGFILENPPTTLSVEDTSSSQDVPSLFKTKTSFPVSLRFISVNSQI